MNISQFSVLLCNAQKSGYIIFTKPDKTEIFEIFDSKKFITSLSLKTTSELNVIILMLESLYYCSNNFS